MSASQVQIATAPEPAVVSTMRIGARRRWLALDLGEVWAYRDLIYFFAWRDIKLRYKQTAIGAAWAILQPVSTMLVFSLFFGKLAKIPSEGLPYPIFYYSALLPWNYFATALQGATNIVVENQRVITKIYFPRVILPISSVLSGLVDVAISFAVLLVLLACYHIVPSGAVIWLPAFTLLAVLTALGVGLWLSALNALYRDVRFIVPFLVQFWMFASPVAYPSSLVPRKWAWLYGLNPLAGVIEGFRWALTGRGSAPSMLLAASAGAVVLLVLSGLLYYHAVEGTIADVV